MLAITPLRSLYTHPLYTIDNSSPYNLEATTRKLKPMVWSIQNELSYRLAYGWKKLI